MVKFKKLLSSSMPVFIHIHFSVQIKALY